MDIQVNFLELSKIYPPPKKKVLLDWLQSKLIAYKGFLIQKSLWQIIEPFIGKAHVKCEPNSGPGLFELVPAFFESEKNKLKTIGLIRVLNLIFLQPCRAQRTL